MSASEHFSQSLFRTTWRDRNEVGATHFHVRIYLAIDHDVPLFAPAATKPATSYFPKGFRVLSCTHTPFLKDICKLWKAGARRAWEAGCDYYVLVGNDIELLDEG